MNISINILNKNQDRSILWVFYNDYAEKKLDYIDFNQANELLNITMFGVSSLLQQNFHCIVCDKLIKALEISKYLGFERAITLTPGAVINSKAVDFLIENKELDVCLETENKSLFGYDINLSKSLFELPKRKKIICDVDKIILTSKINFIKKENGSNLNGIEKNIELNPGLIKANYVDYITYYKKNSSEDLLEKKINESAINRKVYLFNNEDLFSKELRPFKREDIDAVIVPSGGFYSNKLIKFLEIKPKNLVYYDSFRIALNFKKYINKNIYKIRDLKTINDQEYLSSPNQIESEYSLEEEDLVSNDIDNTVYLNLDIVNSPNVFLENILKFNRPFVWLSNIFTFQMNVYLYGPTALYESFSVIINGLKKYKPNTIVQGKSPQGRYFACEAKDYSIEQFGFSPNWERR